MDAETVELYRGCLLKALNELQHMTHLAGDKEGWTAIEGMKNDVKGETRGVVVYHKLMELNKFINEESRQSW